MADTITQTILLDRFGRQYVVMEAQKGADKWGCFVREIDGSLRRLHSHHLPLRDAREEAVQDLRTWLDGTPRANTEQARYGEPARKGGE